MKTSIKNSANQKAHNITMILTIGGLLILQPTLLKKDVWKDI